MLISTKGRYALRVLTDLGQHQHGEYVPLKEIAQRQAISEKYLEGIIKALVKEGVLISLRGKGGGYRLSKEPDEIQVLDILQYTEGSLAPVACLEPGAAPCLRMAACATLPLWKGLDATIRGYLSGYTIQDLMGMPQAGDDYVI